MSSIAPEAAIAKSRMSKPCLSLAWTFAFDCGLFTSAFTLAFVTGFILSSETVSNGNPICVPELPGTCCTHKRRGEPFPDFHRGQVLLRITASHPPDQDMAD